MKTLRLFTAALIALLLLAVPAFAQTTINSTTLSAAVSPTATTVSIGSASCTGCTFGAGTTLYVDTEQIIVAGSYTSGTSNIPVIRQRNEAHVSGATVFVGPANRFAKADPPIGACNKVVQNVNGFYPWFNMLTGGEWLCDNGQNAYTAVLWRVLYPYAIGTQAASR